MSKVLDLLRASGVEVHTRRQWGSRAEALGAYARRLRTHSIGGTVPFHFLHITVTPDTDTVKQGAEGAQRVESYGYSSPPMVSYQLLVTNEGKVFEGQNYGVAGTHTVNDKKIAGFPPRTLNYSGYAVALMQNVEDAVTDVQVDVVARCFAAAELAGYVKRGAPIYPHRKFAWKSCPGDKGFARLAEIQRLKDKYVKEGMGDDVTAQDVWNGDVPKYEVGKDGWAEQDAKWALAQSRMHALRAEQNAKAAVRGVEALAKTLDKLLPGVEKAVREAVKESLADSLVAVDINVAQGAEQRPEPDGD